MRQRHFVDERRALDHVRRRVDMRGVVHRGGDALRQHARLRHVVDALDLDVLEVRPVRRLVAEAMGQIVELQPHAVLEVFFEHHAANSFGHGILPWFVVVETVAAADQAAAEFICVSMARLVASSRSAISACRFWKRWLGTGTEMATALPSGSCRATPAAQMPSVCSSRSKATPLRRAALRSASRASMRVSVFGVRGLIAAPDQRLDRGVGKLRQIGLAVGGAIKREGLAHRRHGAQALRADHLVDEHQLILLHGRQIDGLVQFLAQPLQERPRQRGEVAAHGGRQPQDGRPEPHAPVRRRRDHQLFGFERRDDALHGRAREVHALRDLAEAEAGVFVFQRAQDGGRARDHLHLALVVGDVAVHRQLDTGGTARPPCMMVHVSPICGTGLSTKKFGQRVRRRQWSRRSRSKSILSIPPPNTIGGRPWWTWRLQKLRSSMAR